jgi:hypothetical protein
VGGGLTKETYNEEMTRRRRRESRLGTRKRMRKSPGHGETNGGTKGKRRRNSNKFEKNS